MKIDQSLARLTAQIENLQRLANWLRAHAEQLEQLPEAFLFGPSESFDFDNLTHDEVIKVIQVLGGGKWDKKQSASNSARIDYTATIDGILVRCYQGEPPPSCKLVEVEEYVPEVPAQPATKRKVLKLVCP